MRRLLQQLAIIESNQTETWRWEIVHIIVVAGIFIPLSIHGMYHYFKLHRKVAVKKRSARIVLLTSSLIILELLRRLWLFTYLTVNTYASVKLCYSCLIVIECALYPLLSHALIYSILWRFFVIYYKSNWTKSILMLKKFEEEESHNSHRLSLTIKQDWFIRNKKHMGNVRKNGKLFLALYALSCTSSIILLELSTFYVIPVMVAFVIDSCLLILPSICLVFLCYKTPQIHDSFGIRSEMRIISAITLLGLLAYILIAASYSRIRAVHFYGIISMVQATQYASYNMASLQFVIFMLKRRNIVDADTSNLGKMKYDHPNAIPSPKRTKLRSRLRTVSDLSDVATIVELNDAHKHKQKPNLSPAVSPGLTVHGGSSNESVPSKASTASAVSRDIGKDDIVIVTEHQQEYDAPMSSEEVAMDKEMHHHAGATTIVYSNDATPPPPKSMSVRKKINFHVLLQQILNHPVSYDAFLMHLAKEYSMECIFAVTEFLQFKHYLETDEIFMSEVESDRLERQHSSKQLGKQRSFSVTDLLENMSIGNEPASNHSMNASVPTGKGVQEIIDDIVLPPHLQRSAIVYMFENTQEAKHCDEEYVLQDKREKVRVIIEKLAEKFIFKDGEFQINVPFSIKQQFELLIDTENAEEWHKNESLSCYQLYTMFDECVLEMFRLMTHSLRRFVYTEEYSQIKQILNV